MSASNERGTLTSKERARLRKLSHDLSPVVTIGQAGVTEAVVRSVTEAFHTRELLKMKALEAAPAHIRELARDVAGDVPGAQVVHTIGRTAVLYRPDPDRPSLLA